MHWGRKCCFCLNLELGCVLLGVTGFISSLVLATIGEVFLTLCLQNEFIIGLSHSERIREAILITVVAVALLCVTPNLLLVIGVFKRRPGFLLIYFSFGIFYAIFVVICALQFLLYDQWIKALVIFLMSLIYIRLLMMVYTVYETMQKQNLHRSTSQLTLVDDSIVSTNSQESIIVDI